MDKAKGRSSLRGPGMRRRSSGLSTALKVATAMGKWQRQASIRRESRNDYLDSGDISQSRSSYIDLGESYSGFMGSDTRQLDSL